MTPPSTGAERLAAALCDQVGEAPIIFGLLGDGNLLWVDHAVRHHGARFVATRHEHAAVAAATGHAHATGSPAIATTTHGPGLAQTTSALLTAVRARLPVLLVTGAVHPAARLHAQRADQRALVHATDATYVPVRSASTIEEDLAVALRALVEGPAVLDVDLAVLDGPAGPLPTPSRMAVVPRPAPPPSSPDPAMIERVAGMLTGAHRPLLLLGRGAADAAGPARALADVVGALIGTTLLGQGLLADHPRHIGVVGGFSTPAARAVLQDVDVVLALGASLTRYTVDSGRLLDGATIIQVDRDPRKIGDPVRVEVPIVADACRTTQALVAAVGDQEADVVQRVDIGRPLGARSDRIRNDPEGDDPRDVIEALDAAVPDDRSVVVGVGHYSGWAALGMRTPSPAARLLPWDFGAVGVALGAAIGVAVAGPRRPVVCVEGDGGVMMTLPELDTLAREALPILVVVLDDQGFGAEADILRRADLPTDRAWIPTPDLVAIARGMGLAAESARVPGVGRAVARLLGNLPALLHVRTSRQAVHHEIFAALGP